MTFHTNTSKVANDIKRDFQEYSQLKDAKVEESTSSSFQGQGAAEMWQQAFRQVRQADRKSSIWLPSTQLIVCKHPHPRLSRPPLAQHAVLLPIFLRPRFPVG